LDKKLNLTSNPIGRLLRQIAIPASTGSLFQTLFNIIDTFYAGKISPESLAALAKSFPLYFIIVAAGVGIVSGCNSLIGNAIGERNKIAASIYAHNTIVYSILLSFFITFIGIYFSYDLLKFMGNNEENIMLAKKYTDIIFLGSIIFLIQFSFNSILNSQGDTKSFRNFMLVGIIANIILNPIFIFGLFFIPAFGIAGLAISTMLIQFVGCIYLYSKVNKLEIKIILNIKNFYIRRNFFRNIFDQAMPITFSLFMVSVGGFILLSFLTIFGDKAIAGYGSALRFEQVFILPIIGLNIAVLSIAGQNFGARRYDRVREVYFKGVSIGILVMCFSGIIIYLLSEPIISIFSNDLEVIKFGSSYLKITAFICPVYPIFFISHALFAALKKSYFIFYMNLLRMVILPFIIVWTTINIMNGYFHDIFYGLLIMNWILGLLVLLIARGLMIKTFKEQKKAFFIF
tara:strand:+ start:3449 stop:4822 length:1374 start_codon:yes stop_codon:yes gene_type:complete